jgi:hypothetical protein
MARRYIYGIRITNRTERVPEVQRLLTEYGCNIRSRLGLHYVGPDYCAPDGLILVEMYGDEAEVSALWDKLAAIPGLELQRMVFEQ